MLKSILTSNLTLSLTSPNIPNPDQEPSALLNIQQSSHDNNKHAQLTDTFDSNIQATSNENPRILITSSKINEQTSTTSETISKKVAPKQPENTTNSNQQLHISNNHLKNVTMTSKSSRSNSIDQLIAAAAVTANSSACMSPLSPLHSPVANTKTADSAQSDSVDSNELTVSRKNLNTIVEAIFHVEGMKHDFVWLYF